MTARTIPLDPTMFHPEPAELVSGPKLRAFLHTYATGVAGIRIESAVGHIEVLPFVGQQVWRARLGGRELAMVTPFERPVPPERYTDYDAGNGAYLIHCGGTAMGIPGALDTHPVHGELPFAPHENVELVVDDSSITVRGSASIGSSVRADIELTVTRGSALLESSVSLTNLGDAPTSLMYLAHTNFRPAPGGHLEETLRVGERISSRMDVDLDGVPFDTSRLDDGTVSMDRLLEPGVRVEPQVIQGVPAARDDAGWVTTRVRHLDGSADVVRHDSPDLTHSVRWIKRTADTDAFAFAMPATATPGGLAAENALGNVRFYAPGESLRVRYWHGMEPAV